MKCTKDVRYITQQNYSYYIQIQCVMCQSPQYDDYFRAELRRYEHQQINTFLVWQSSVGDDIFRNVAASVAP